MNKEWKVSSNRVNGNVYYQIYRNLYDNEPDHSGNREYYEDKIFDSKQKAQNTADWLNEVVY